MRKDPLTVPELLLIERMAWKIREGAADPVRGYTRIRSLLSAAQEKFDDLTLEVEELKEAIKTRGRSKTNDEPTSGGDVRKSPSKNSKTTSKKRSKAASKRVADDKDNT